jgi:hypothetical protein
MEAQKVRTRKIKFIHFAFLYKANKNIETPKGPLKIDASDSLTDILYSLKANIIALWCIF